MKMRLFFIRRRNVCGHPSIGCGQIGTAAEETTPPSITQSEPWQFTIAVLGWLAGMDGTIGVRGVNADIDICLDQVPQYLGMLFAARAEARKGPFRIYGQSI